MPLFMSFFFLKITMNQGKLLITAAAMTPVFDHDDNGETNVGVFSGMQTS